MIVTNLEIS